jgi:hypothetical protein
MLSIRILTACFTVPYLFKLTNDDLFVLNQIFSPLLSHGRTQGVHYLVISLWGPKTPGDLPEDSENINFCCLLEDHGRK